MNEEDGSETALLYVKGSLTEAVSSEEGGGLNST